MSAREEIRLSFAPPEVVYLAGLVDEFITVIADADETSDSGVERLTPNPYPEDAEASAEFATATRDDLLDRRTADATVVRNGLSEAADVVIPWKELDSWLRTLTALRLVIAARLGLSDDDGDHDPEDPRFGVFDWLGYRLDELVTLADAQDDFPEDA